MAQDPTLAHESSDQNPLREPRHIRSIAEVETQRRSRLLKYLILALGGFFTSFLLFLSFHTLTTGLTPGNVSGLAALSAPLILCIIGYRLNRTPTPRRVTAAAYLVLSGFVGALMLSFAFYPGGMGAETLRLYDLLLIPTIAAGVVIDPAAAFIFASIISLYISTITVLGDASPSLIAYEFGPLAACNTPAIQHLGAPALQQCPFLLAHAFSSQAVNPVGIILQPAALQFVTAFLTWLSMRSIQWAYQAVDRAAELEAAYRTVAEQKRQLEEDIQLLQDTYARVVKGDYGVRAHLEGHILWPLAQSFNTLLDRLGRTLIQGQRLARLESDIRYLTESLERGQRGLPWAWPVPAGTPLDELVHVLQTASVDPSSFPLPEVSRSRPEQSPH